MAGPLQRFTIISILIASAMLSVGQTIAIIDAKQPHLARRSPTRSGRSSIRSARGLRPARPAWVPDYAPDPGQDGVARIHWLRLEGENLHGRMQYSLFEDRWEPTGPEGSRLLYGRPLRRPPAGERRPTLHPVPPELWRWVLLTELRRPTEFAAIELPPRGVPLRALAYRQQQSVLSRMMHSGHRLTTPELQRAMAYLDAVRLPCWRPPEPVLSENDETEASRSTAPSRRSSVSMASAGASIGGSSSADSWVPTDTRELALDRALRSRRSSVSSRLRSSDSTQTPVWTPTSQYRPPGPPWMRGGSTP